MNPSGELRSMLGQLAALAPDEREFVLGELGETAAQKLLPMIEATSRLRMSGSLTRASSEARQGLTPPGMTQRAAQALVEAVRDHDSLVKSAPGRAGDRPQSLAGALWQTLKGGA
ncbi:MAG: hypothetical protein C0515_01280 [Novosphingobium sp.]|nr:hypothetical protein [Novosphingobium sp.]